MVNMLRAGAAGGGAAGAERPLRACSGCSGGSGAAFGLFRRETQGYGFTARGGCVFAVRSAGACGISCVNARWQGK